MNQPVLQEKELSTQINRMLKQQLTSDFQGVF